MAIFVPYNLSLSREDNLSRSSPFAHFGPPYYPNAMWVNSILIQEPKILFHELCRDQENSKIEKFYWSRAETDIRLPTVYRWRDLRVTHMKMARPCAANYRSSTNETHRRWINHSSSLATVAPRNGIKNVLEVSYHMKLFLRDTSKCTNAVNVLATTATTCPNH